MVNQPETDARTKNSAGKNIDKNNNKNPHVRPLLVHGFSYEMIYRLASPRTILPFVFLTAGAPVLLAGMILPLLAISHTTSRLGAAPFVASATLKKSYMAFGSAMITASLVLIALTSDGNSTILMLAMFLLATVFIGIGQGVTGLAYYAITPALLDKDRRSWLMNTQNTLSAIVGIGLALVLHFYLKDTTPLNSHLMLIWAAAAFSFITIVAVLPIKEPRRGMSEQSVTDQKSPDLSTRLQQVRDNFSMTIKHRWFRNYLVLQVLFLSVSSTLPFYSIHAASLHKNSAGALSIFVVAICVGIIVGGPIMIRLSKKSLRMTMVFSGIVAAISATMAIGLEFSQQYTHYYYYTPVFLLMSLASQGLAITVSVYLGELAPKNEREYFFAVSFFVTGVLGILAATILGFIAHFQDEVIPIAIILIANIIAAFYVKTLPSELQGSDLAVQSLSEHERNARMGVSSNGGH